MDQTIILFVWRVHNKFIKQILIYVNKNLRIEQITKFIKQTRFLPSKDSTLQTNE